MTEIAEELRVAALAAFTPMVISVSSSTPSHVNVDYVIDALMRDEALAQNMFVIDAKNFVSDVKPPASKPGRSSEGKGKNAKDQVDPTKKPSAQVFAEYLRIAVEREVARRDVIEARKQKLEFLRQQYLEDGFTEEEALQAAEEDLQDSEEPAYEDSETDFNSRPQLLVCIRDYPKSLTDIVELSQENMTLHAVLDVQSRAPIGIEETWDKPRASRSGSRQRNISSAGKRGKTSEEPRGGTTLLSQLAEREQTVDKKYNAADEVVVETYEFPTDALAAHAQPDGAPVYRLIIPERDGMAAIRDTLFHLEERLHAYREWMAKRTVADVPSYTPLPNPDAPKPPPVEEVVETKGRRRSASQGKKSAAIIEPEEPPAPLTTPPYPRDMSEVAARREEYEASMAALSTDGTPFTIAEFVRRCCAQSGVSGNNGLLLSEGELKEKEMMRQREAASRYAQYVLSQALGKKHKSANPASASAPAEQPLVASPAEGQKEGEEEAVTAPPTEGPLVLEGDDLREAVRQAIVTLSAHLTPEQVEVQLNNVMSCILVKVCGSDDQFIDEQLCNKNMLGWQESFAKWKGRHDLHVFSRGNGLSRTQNTTYNFDKLTTFPMFHSYLNYCEAERGFFYPPPPDSDEEDSPSESSSEEDEEDEEGNIIPRKKKEPEPFPLLDHVEIIQDASRRRRAYEEVRRYTSVPVRQELVSHGLGSHAAVEEVEWMFPADGTTIEVERTVCNTRQMHCVVTPLTGFQFGFTHSDTDILVSGSGGASSVSSFIPCNVRSSIRSGSDLTVVAEVVADNSVEAEMAAYQAALEAATLEAKAQFEALATRPKSSRKEKRGTPQPTLASLEEACTASLVKPTPRAKNPPLLRLVATIAEPDCTATFDEASATLQVSSNKPLHMQLPVSLKVRVWRSSRLEEVHLVSFSHVNYFMGGFVEILSPQADGYRVVLGPKGTYMTSRDNHTLFVTSSGRCVLRTAEGGESPTELTPVQVSTSVDLTTKNHVLQRADGVHLSYSNAGQLQSVSFGSHVRAHWSNGNCIWHITGVPVVRCSPELARLSLESGFSTMEFDHAKHAATITRSGEDASALFDFVEYKLEVHSQSLRSHYTVDCAFGGLHANVTETTSSNVTPSSSSPPRPVTYRVSPLGRCSEERDGLVVCPVEYITPEFQPLVQHKEILCPLFEAALKGTSVSADGDALHLMSSYTFRGAAEGEQGEDAMGGAVALRDTVVDYFAAKTQDELRHLAPRRQTAADNRPLLCCSLVLDQCTHRVDLLPPPFFRQLVREWQRRADSQFTHPQPLGAATVEGGQLLAVQPRANLLATETPHKLTMPSSIFALPSEGCCAPAASCRLGGSDGCTPHLDWYVVLKHPEGGAILSDSNLSEALTTENVKGAIDTSLKTLEEQFAPRLPQAAATSPSAEAAAEGGSQTKPTRPAPKKKQQTAASGRLSYWGSHAAPAAVAAAPTVQEDAVKTVATPPKNNSGPTLLGAIHSVVQGADRTPLMQSHLEQHHLDNSAMGMGTTASTRGHSPDLYLTPRACQFGTVMEQRRYAALLCVTNTSTVPCRFRVSVPNALKGSLSVDFPKRFLAPGLTYTIQVNLSGWQPLGERSELLHLNHEGGSVDIPVTWSTVQSEAETALASDVVCLGPAEYAFEPGTTKRFKVKGPDDLPSEEEELEHTTSSDEEIEVLA